MRHATLPFAVLALGCPTLNARTAVTEAEFVPGELLVRFREPPVARWLAELEAELGPPVAWTEPRHAPRARERADEPHPLACFRLARIAAETDVGALSARVAAHPAVRWASTNNRPEPTDLPDDPLLFGQWAHRKISTAPGWELAAGGRRVVVGIVDTGCRIDHEDLIAQIWRNDDPPNGIDDDGNGFVDDTFGWDFKQQDNTLDDVFGHGTQVAGIVAATRDNGVGVAGIGDLTLLTAKWWHQTGSDLTVAESVCYAVDNGAHVLNLSLGCPCLMPMTEEAIRYARRNGVVVVAGAGNSGDATPHYPAAYEEVISVSAITIKDELASFSSFGPHLDLAAPSPGILTTKGKGVAQYDPSFGGTSAAAPHVAGLVGSMLSIEPELSPDEVRALLRTHAEDVGPPGFDRSFGHGRIDVQATLAAVRSRPKGGAHAVERGPCASRTTSAGCAPTMAVDSWAAVSGAGDVRIHARRVQGFRSGFALFSPTGRAGVPFGTGTLCLAPPVGRFEVQSSQGSDPLACDGAFAQTVNDGGSHDPGPGRTAWYQWWVRDPAGSGAAGGAVSVGMVLSEVAEVSFR